MPHLVVAAAGPDQPGIVAEFTRVFLDHGCNLEDTSMTVLRGQFAMMLVVDAPSEVSSEALERELEAATAIFGLVVSVWAVPGKTSAAPAGESWSLSIYGADRPGIVHRVARALAERDVNIVDLATRLTTSDGSPIYSMLMGVTLPAETNVEELRSHLDSVAAELGVECTLHPAEADVL